MTAGKEDKALADLTGFTSTWFTLGLIDGELLDAMCREWQEDGGHSPEHYRYRAFRRFLAANRLLSAELVTALYELGDADPEPAMGSALLADLALLPECPPAILNAARASDRPVLSQLVTRWHPETAPDGETEARD